MISPYKTTSLTARHALCALMCLFLDLAHLSPTMRATMRATMRPTMAAPPPLPLSLLSGDTPTEVVAEQVEWDEAAGLLTARGVRLTQRPTGGEGAGGALTLTCPAATLRLGPRGPTGALTLTAVHLTGGVRLESAEGVVSAGEALWDEGGALTLSGGARGEWRGQRVEATRATVHLRDRRLTLEGVRARLTLPALLPSPLRSTGALPPRR